MRPHFSEICKVLDKLVDQHAPNIPIPAKNKNMNTTDAKISNNNDYTNHLDKTLKGMLFSFIPSFVGLIFIVFIRK